MKNEGQNEEISCNTLELCSHVFSNVMIKCFFGSKSCNEKINGIPAYLFML